MDHFSSKPTSSRTSTLPVGKHWAASEAQDAPEPHPSPSASGLVINRIPAHRPARRTVTLDVGRRDIRISRKLPPSGKTSSAPHSGGGPRNRISRFSPASARRLLFTARNFPGMKIMLTLTYPGEFPLDGRLVKDHWRRMRQWLVRNGNPIGLWILEFQNRGAPHFHVFVEHELDPQAVSNIWYQIVGTQDPRHLVAGTRCEYLRHPHAVGAYAAKYAAKSDQKDVPKEFENVGRFWGTWGNPEITQTCTLPIETAAQVVRVLRTAYKKERETWKYRRKKFRDKGVVGFVAWEISTGVQKYLGTQSIPIIEDYSLTDF